MGMPDMNNPSLIAVGMPSNNPKGEAFNQRSSLFLRLTTPSPPSKDKKRSPLDLML